LKSLGKFGVDERFRAKMTEKNEKVVYKEIFGNADKKINENLIMKTKIIMGDKFSELYPKWSLTDPNPIDYHGAEASQPDNRQTFSHSHHFGQSTAMPISDQQSFRSTVAHGPHQG
jgi:hypothetical protein